jgi:hypothetical protein
MPNFPGLNSPFLSNHPPPSNKPDSSVWKLCIGPFWHQANSADLLPKKQRQISNTAAIHACLECFTIQYFYMRSAINSSARFSLRHNLESKRWLAWIMGDDVIHKKHATPAVG